MCKKESGFSRKKVSANGGPSTPAPIGATLMKTGQTTSYRTGDDGDIEAGRGVDWFTLPLDKDGNQLLNPFGNNKRFTGITGGYQIGGVNYNASGGTTTAALAFPNDIVIDWSTNKSDRTKVLGYKRTLETSAIWNTAIDNALTASVGSYNSGWYMINRTELLNLFNASVLALNYNPFNLPDSTIIATSTTWAGATTFMWRWNGVNGSLSFGIKSDPNPYLIVRTFTVTGTTLT